MTALRVLFIRRDRDHQLGLRARGGRRGPRGHRAEPGHDRQAAARRRCAAAHRRCPGPGVHAAGALQGRDFDVVIDFVAFTTDHVRADVELFRGRVGQYVYISSASAYQTPPVHLPITEGTPLVNPYWQYSRDKIASEELLTRALRDEQFPVTIVRPSHTYDATSVPTTGGWTDIARMRAGKPVVVHGDGASTWVLTHHLDFAARVHRAAGAAYRDRRRRPHHLRRGAELGPRCTGRWPMPPASASPSSCT